MAKLNFNNSVFVVKVYETINPSIVESFPATEDGLNDAKQYAYILQKNNKGKYDVVVPATLVKLF